MSEQDHDAGSEWAWVGCMIFFFIIGLFIVAGASTGVN